MICLLTSSTYLRVNRQNAPGCKILTIKNYPFVFKAYFLTNMYNNHLPIIISYDAKRLLISDQPNLNSRNQKNQRKGVPISALAY